MLLDIADNICKGQEQSGLTVEIRAVIGSHKKVDMLQPVRRLLGAEPPDTGICAHIAEILFLPIENVRAHT